MLKIGNKIFSNNIIQGPLAGISCAPFRRLVWQYSQPAYVCSEMISCKTLLYQPEFSKKRFVYKDPQEGPICFQLSGNDAKEVAEATKKLTDYGADLIDLNCGCPVKKIRSRGSGSSLLTNPNKLYELIIALKVNTHLPVGIKIRVEGQSAEKFNNDIIKVVKDSGVDFLVVHGRHWTEHYEVPCRYNEIQHFVNELTIPVIGNGDIFTIESLKTMFTTGCSGVMLSRAGVGQPWLINKLQAEMQQQLFPIPNSKAIGLIFKEHVFELAKLLNHEKFAILQARKFAKYYARNLENKLEFCNEINNCDDLNKLELICDKYFI